MTSICGNLIIYKDTMLHKNNEKYKTARDLNLIDRYWGVLKIRGNEVLFLADSCIFCNVKKKIIK